MNQKGPVLAVEDGETPFRFSVSDLRVGNSVMYNGSPFSVYSISSPLPSSAPAFDSVPVVTLCDGGLIDVPLAAVEPAPLTEGLKSLLGWAARFRTRPILYVHDLENLYFAITGREIHSNMYR
jgi:hypothetical protein